MFLTAVNSQHNWIHKVRFLCHILPSVLSCAGVVTGTRGASQKPTSRTSVSHWCTLSSVMWPEHAKRAQLVRRPDMQQLCHISSVRSLPFVEELEWCVCMAAGKWRTVWTIRNGSDNILLTVQDEKELPFKKDNLQYWRWEDKMNILWKQRGFTFFVSYRHCGWPYIVR